MAHLNSILYLMYLNQGKLNMASKKKTIILLTLFVLMMATAEFAIAGGCSHSKFEKVQSSFSEFLEIQAQKRLRGLAVKHCQNQNTDLYLIEGVSVLDMEIKDIDEAIASLKRTIQIGEDVSYAWAKLIRRCEGNNSEATRWARDKQKITDEGISVTQELLRVIENCNEDKKEIRKFINAL